MRTFTVPVDGVNVELLDEQLRTALGSVYLGLRADDREVLLAADNAISDAEIQLGRDIVRNHDANALTAQQQALADLQGEMTTLKQSVGDIDNLTATEATDAIKLLYKALKLNDLL